MKFFLISLFLFALHLEAGANKNYFIGEINKETLFNDYEQFIFAYEDFNPAKKTILNLSDIEITIMFGIWCHDSKREVPRMLKILDSYNFPKEKLSLIAVNRLKTKPHKDVEKYALEFTPTIIFFRDSYEIGRIVEKPKKSLEIDILEILLLK